MVFSLNFSEAWIPSGAFRPRLLGAANCRLSGATARLTSVSSQRSEGRAHLHHISTTTHTQLPRKPTQDPPAVALRPCKLQERTHTHTIPAIPPLMISRLLFLVFCFHQICGHHFGADKPDIILLSTRSTEAAGVSSGDGDRRNVIRPPQTAFLNAACTLQSCARRSRCEAEKIKVISNFNK